MGLFDSVKGAVGGLIGSVDPDQVTGASTRSIRVACPAC